MTLIDPRDALAEQSSFIYYLLGSASFGQVVRCLTAGDGCPNEPSPTNDDFVHMLLGIASIGDSIKRLAGNDAPQECPDLTKDVGDSPSTRWLR